MASNKHSHVRQALTQFQPTSIKQLDDLPGVHPRHARCRWMSQHALDLGMLQELIASASRNAIHACQDELRDDGRITILAVEAHQSHLWWESKVLQIGRDGSECGGQFTAIIAIALACIRADPLARVHLQRRGARADHLATLASSVARRTDGIQSASCCRQGGIAGQRALPCCLTRRIDVKDNVAARLSVEDAANGFRGPGIARRYAAGRACGTLLNTDDPQREDQRLRLERWGRPLRPKSAMNAVSKGSNRSKKSARVRSPLMA